MDFISERPILIIGGRTLCVSKVVRQAEKRLRQWSSEIQICDGIDKVDPTTTSPNTLVLCLSDLDKTFFSSSVTSEKLETFQEFLSSARNIMWVTCGHLLDDSYPNTMVGIGRSLTAEMPHLNIHYLEFRKQESWDICIIVAKVLKMGI